MKRKDKTLLIILSFLFILLTVSGSFLLLSNNPERFEKVLTFDKYNSILELSELEYSKDSAVSKNIAFIDEFITQEDGNTCFQLLVYSPKTKELVRESICEDVAAINWENPYNDYIELIPIEVELEFTKTSFLKFELKDITFSLLSDEYVYDLIDQNKSMEEIRGQIYFKHLEEIAQKGYYKSSPIPVGKGFFGTLIFSDIEVIKITVSGNKLKLYLNTEINGEDVNLIINTKSFGYSEAETSEVPIQITKSNFTSLKLDSSYVASFTYFDRLTLPSEEEVSEFCSIEDGGFIIESICDNIDIANYKLFEIEDLDTYITEETRNKTVVELEKLNLNSLIKI